MTVRTPWSYVLLSVTLLHCFTDALPAVEEVRNGTELPANPSFTRDIQPILARACTSCHGGVKQAADVSFVSSQSVLPPEGWIIEPGNAADSILMHRVTSTDPDERMPPPDEHPAPLSDDEIELLRRWIDQGANWQQHWSRRPLNSTLPSAAVPRASELRQSDWSRSPIDVLVLKRIDEEGLQPSAAAEPVQWLRRVTLDLTGLPPTPSEIESFCTSVAAASSQDAVEAVYSQSAERLLASEHFGERWAALWMDLARYADSKGFEKDPHRDIWPYRDWLIDAFNSDMPYDQFTIKQLAGDLVPEPTYDDLLATAFHRNTQTNTEGGTDDEEYRVAAVIDRLTTTWTVWQGTTFGCVQCHDHPYEPYRNEEFYSGLAYFNNTEDCDLDSEFPTVPYLESTEQRREFVQLSNEKVSLQKEIDAIGRRAVESSSWQPLPFSSMESTSGELGMLDEDIAVVAGTVAVGSTYELECEPESDLTALRIRIYPNSDNPTDWPEQGSVLSQLKLTFQVEDAEPQDVPLALVVPDHRSGPYDANEMLKAGAEGFGGYPKLFGPRWVVVTLREPLELTPGGTLRMELVQKASVTGGLSTHLRRFRIEATSSDALGQLSDDSKMIELRKQIESIDEKLAKLDGIPVPVFQVREVSAARDDRAFIRGNFLEKGDKVTPAIPAVFGKSAEGEALPPITNRLEFAQWLVSENNPLAARVWANRVWAALFGIGIVETLEDFGVSGQRPSHPELLDLLAYQMQFECDWSLKRFLKGIVLSSTYRQDSRASKELVDRDPTNRLLARGPRTRLTAEMVRDQALMASGLLQPIIGGPSVMPPQPEGVWQQAYSSAKWETAEGENRYRRGLYTYWRRTSPYPGFIMFDAPSRDVCSPRRIATNTPLQALVTLNSEVFTEMAAAIARRCQDAHPDDDESAIVEMFLHVTSREPSTSDMASLLELLRDLRIELEQPPSPKSPMQVTTVQETTVQETAAEEAASQEANAEQTSPTEKLEPMGVVALAILNSDWALTK